MTETRTNIFLSYAREDTSMAKRIYHDLNQYDFKVWFDQVSLLPGKNWQVEIEKAIKNCDYFLALLSNNSISKKGYFQKELKLAMDVLDLYPESDVFIIPIRLENCEVKNEKLSQRQYVDLFPETEYQEGINKIFKSVNPQMFMLRSQAIELPVQESINMIRSHGFYDRNKNPMGKGFSNNFDVKTHNGDNIVLDKLTGLIWQQGGSSGEMILSDAKKYIENLNDKRYEGNHFLRLPTLEEAMSLLKSDKSRDGVNCDPAFHFAQWHIWTCDLEKAGTRTKAWMVDFSQGLCHNEHIDMKHFVRAVYSGKEYKF